MSQPQNPILSSMPQDSARPQDARWNALVSLSEQLAAGSASGGAGLRTGAAPELAASAARSTGVAALLGALTGASRAAGRHYAAAARGEISHGAYAARVGASMLVAGAASAGRSAGTMAVKVGTHEVARRLGATGVKHFVGGTAGTFAAFAVVEQSIESVRFARGGITREEFGARTLENVSGFGAGYGGAVAGAALGSVVPVLGTAAGAVLGGLLGSLGGVRIARAVVQVASRAEAPTSRSQSVAATDDASDSTPEPAAT